MSDIDHGVAQWVGERELQEDTWRVDTLADGSLLAAIADGMGGAPGGAEASGVVIECVAQGFANQESPEIAFRHLLARARTRLAGIETENPALKGLGSTLICVHLEEGRLRWLNVGDSHLYLLRRKRLRHLNFSHNLGAVLEAQGGETQPGDHTLDPALYSHILLSVVNANKPEMIDLPEQPFPLQGGDRLLLASDGIDVLSLDQLRAGLSADGTAQELADGLIRAVREINRAMQDNVTAVVIALA